MMMHHPTNADVSKLIALAEDDAEMRSVIMDALVADGYEVGEYARGDTLLEGLLNADKPGLIVADVRMPGGDGLSVLRALRGIGYDVPIVVITGFACEQTLNDAFRLGASVVLSKPFAMEDLRHVVGCFLPPPRASLR